MKVSASVTRSSVNQKHSSKSPLLLEAILSTFLTITFHFRMSGLAPLCNSSTFIIRYQNEVIQVTDPWQIANHWGPSFSETIFIKRHLNYEIKSKLMGGRHSIEQFLRLTIDHSFSITSDFADDLILLAREFEARTLETVIHSSIEGMLRKGAPMINVVVVDLTGDHRVVQVNDKWSCHELKRIVMEKLGMSQAQSEFYSLINEGRVVQGSMSCADRGIRQGSTIHVNGLTMG
jgi:hypothetical protein